MSAETEPADSNLQLEPFTSLENRKIPHQDDEFRGLLLTIYSIFLLIGLPVWWYFTNVPTISIPSEFPQILKEHFSDPIEVSVDVYFENETLLKFPIEEEIIRISHFSFQVQPKGIYKTGQHLTNYVTNHFNLIYSDNSDNSGGRSLKISYDKDVKSVLKEISESFKIPNLRKSNLKLKFTKISSFKEGSGPFKLSDNFRNFLNHLSPILTTSITFQTKYFEKSHIIKNVNNVEAFIEKENLRDERGWDDIFNFIYIVNHEADPSNLFIPNWGVIVNDSDEEVVMKTFLSGLQKFLGFPQWSGGEMIEIDFWIEEMKKFYLKKASEMISQLSNNEKLIISPEIYESKLLPAIKLLKVKNDIKTAFDLIESAHHDPKLIPAAYFPDDHKFAVYLPVYLPLILPIFVALISIIKEIKNKKSMSKYNKEKTN